MGAAPSHEDDGIEPEPDQDEEDQEDDDDDIIPMARDRFLVSSKLKIYYLI